MGLMVKNGSGRQNPIDTRDCGRCENKWRSRENAFPSELSCRSGVAWLPVYCSYRAFKCTLMAFQAIALNSSWESRPRGIPCAVSCDSLNERAAASGRRWPDRFRCCLARTESPGAPGSPDKTSLVFERKNATAARRQEFLRSARFLDTKRICRPAATIHTVK